MAVRTRHLAAVAVLLAACIHAGSGHAQPARAPDKTPSADDPAVRARALHDEGVAHYERGALDDAIRAFSDAYALYPSPGFLFNLGQAYEQKGDCGRARDMYTRALEAGPSESNRARVEARLAVVEACLARATTAGAAQSSRADGRAPGQNGSDRSIETSHAPSRTVPILLGVAGLAVAGAGGGTLIWVNADYEDRRDTCSGRCPPESVDDLRGRALAGYVLLSAGAALVAGAVVWWLLDRSPSTSGSSARALPLEMRF